MMEVSYHSTVIYRENWELGEKLAPEGPGGFQGCGLWATAIGIGKGPCDDLVKLADELKSEGIVVSIGTLCQKVSLLKALDRNRLVLNNGMVIK